MQRLCLIKHDRYLFDCNFFLIRKLSTLASPWYIADKMLPTLTVTEVSYLNVKFWRYQITVFRIFTIGVTLAVFSALVMWIQSELSESCNKLKCKFGMLKCRAFFFHRCADLPRCAPLELHDRRRTSSNLSSTIIAAVAECAAPLRVLVACMKRACLKLKIKWVRVWGDASPRRSDAESTDLEEHQQRQHIIAEVVENM